MIIPWASQPKNPLSEVESVEGAGGAVDWVEGD